MSTLGKLVRDYEIWEPAPKDGPQPVIHPATAGVHEGSQYWVQEDPELVDLVLPVSDVVVRGDSSTPIDIGALVTATLSRSRTAG